MDWEVKSKPSTLHDKPVWTWPVVWAWAQKGNSGARRQRNHFWVSSNSCNRSRASMKAKWPHGLGDKGHWQAVYHSFSHRDLLSPLLERSTTFCKYWLGLLFYSNAHHSRCQTGICASCELTCSSEYTSTGIQWCTAYPKCTHMGTIVGGYWNRGQQSWGSLSSVGDCSSWCPCQYRAWNQCTSCFQCHLYQLHKVSSLDSICPLSANHIYRYYWDISGHLPSLSGFRLEPSIRASRIDGAVYIQAYTTNKVVVYNVEEGHHAKHLTTAEVLGPWQPPRTLNGLYTIYEKAQTHNPSKAWLEVRVPYVVADHILTTINSDAIHGCLCAFTCADWW